MANLQYESFNPAAVTITFHSPYVHPVTAKDKMVHSVKITNEIMNKFTETESSSLFPSTTWKKVVQVIVEIYDLFATENKN